MTTNSLVLQQVEIIGSGALGSLFAAFLESQTAITMLSHWEEQIEAVQAKGLILLDRAGNATTHEFRITNNPRDLLPASLALVLVKSYQTARTGFELAPILAPDGVAITLQNGLGNLEVLQAALGHGRVIQGVTAQGAMMLEPGRVKHAGTGLTYFAHLPGKDHVLSHLTNLLNAAGLPAKILADVKSLQWGKLAVNAGINPLTAILRVPNGHLIEHEIVSQVMCAAAEETALVAKALGISLPFPDASERVMEVAEATATNFSSMLQDVLRGVPTEIDAINGAVANHGRLTGVPTPINDELWRQVRNIQVQPTNNFAVDEQMVLKNLLKMIHGGQE